MSVGAIKEIETLFNAMQRNIAKKDLITIMLKTAECFHSLLTIGNELIF